MAGRSVLYPPGFPSTDPRVLQSSGQYHAVPGSSSSTIPVSHAVMYGQHIPAQVSAGVPYLFREGHFQVSFYMHSYAVMLH